MSASIDLLRATVIAAGGSIFETAAGTIAVIPNRAADPEELLPLPDAARAAATSLRVVRDAIRSQALPAVGRQRDRAVRRRDLDAWIETRRAPVARVTESQAERIERRLARARRDAA
jgi:hypothetical protein